MVFNPLFLQNTLGVENVHPEKVNKLNSSGYLFSDIINVFMNTDETDSLTKLTQEFLGSAQIKESNGTPFILSLLGETSISSADISKNLQLNIEDFLPSGLKQKLVEIEGENNKSVSEKSLNVDQNQLTQILETINQLLGLAKANDGEDTKNAAVDLSETTNLLEESDGVFLIVETADKIFNINISKQTEDKIIGSEGETGTNENLYKIKLTAISEKSLANLADSGILANSAGNESKLSSLPFESGMAAENTNNSVVKVKIFTSQNAGSENALVVNSKGKFQLVESAANQGQTQVLETEPKKETNEAVNINIGKTADSTEGIKAAVPQKMVTEPTTKEEIKSSKENVGNSKVISENKIPAEKLNFKNSEETKNEKNVPKTETQAGKTIKAETVVVKDEIKAGTVKEALDSLPKSELKEASEFKNIVKEEAAKPVEKTAHEKINVDREKRELDTKSFEKFSSENKDNEQLNVKVNKAVKNITTIKSENVPQQNADKSVKENSETKTNSTDEKVKTVQTAESNEKNLGQNENSFKQAEDNKHVAFDANKVGSTQAKEKFTVEAPVSNSNSERFVKAAELMREISRYIEKQDKSTLTIKISPEELGKVKITMDITDQNVKANIHVENEAVKTIIEKNIVELQNQLSKSGINLTSVNISMAEGEQKNAKQFAGKKKSGEFDLKGKTEDEGEEEKVKMMGYNTMEYLA